MKTRMIEWAEQICTPGSFTNTVRFLLRRHYRIDDERHLLRKPLIETIFETYDDVTTDFTNTTEHSCRGLTAAGVFDPFKNLREML